MRASVCVRQRQKEKERDKEREWGRYEIDNMKTKGWGLFFTTVRQQKLTPGDEVC